MHMSLKPMLSTGNMSQPFPLPGAKSGLHVPPLQFIRWPWAIGLWGQWKKDILATNIWLVVFISNIVKGKYQGRLETENHQSNSILIGWHFHICWLNFFCCFSIPILAALIPSLVGEHPIFIAHFCWLHPYSLVKSSFGLVNFIMTGELPSFVGERWLNQASCAKTPSRSSTLQLICPGVEISMAIVEKGIRTCGFRCEGFGSLRQLEHAWTYGISNMKVVCNYIIVRTKWSHSLTKRVIQTISWRLSLNFFCGQYHNFSKAMDVEIHRDVTSHQMVTMQRRIPSIYPWKAWLGVADWIGSPKIELSPSSFTQIVSNKPGPKSHIWGKPILIRLFTIRGNKWIFWINLKMKRA